MKRAGQAQPPMHALSREVGKRLAARGWMLATAESCTGGLLGALITGVPGSSAYYVGGVVSYADSAKIRLLGVPRALLAEHGAVSASVAREMAGGVRRRLKADIGVGITGIAGPGGGSDRKPVGLVFISLAGPSGCLTRRFLFAGGRDSIRRAACVAALVWLREAGAMPG